MLMAGQPTIREVIAFPKNTAMASLMDGSPAPVDNEQMAQVGLQITVTEDTGTEDTATEDEDGL